MKAADHSPGPRGSRATRAVVLLIALIAVVVALTWPLASASTTHLPATHIVARTDALVAGWVLAVQSHALATDPLQIGEGNIFYPARHALFYGPTGTGALPLFAPVFLASGNPTLALNVTLILGLALTAWTMALVVRRWTGSDGAALVAASFLLTSSWLMRGMVETAPFTAALFYFPVIAYLAARTTTGRQALGLGLLVALQCLVDTAYVAPAVLLPLGLLTASRLTRPATRRAGVHLAAALALAMLLMAPVLAGYLAVSAANPDLARQTVWETVRLPLPLPHGLFADGSSRAIPGFLLLFLALAAVLELWRRRREPRPEAPSIWAHGALWFVCGVLMSLPPSGMLGGHWVRLPLYYLKAIVPALGLIRTQDRLGVAALMGAALLAGAAVATVQRALAERVAAARLRWLPRLVSPLLIVALYVTSRHFDPARWPAPASFRIFPAPRWSEAAASVLRGAHGAVLEVPIPPLEHADTSVVARSMYRSTQYWRPLLNGHHSYYPSDYPQRLALAVRVPEPDALAVLRREADLSMLAVSLASLPAEERERWQRFARNTPPGLRLRHQSSDELVFEVGDGSGGGG